jgi:hypothetical protein
METVIKRTTIPENSVISNGFDRIDYCDAYRVVKPTDDNAEDIANEIFKLPKWAKGLMNIRNSIAGIFRLKSKKETSEEQTTYFAVIEKSENEIVMGENDKHLNFRVSVLIDRTNSFIYLTTLVHFNNFWGRAYFFPVKPFHKIIVKSILKRQINEKSKNLEV